MDAVTETQKKTPTPSNSEQTAAQGEKMEKTETEKKDETKDTPAKEPRKQGPAHDPSGLLRRVSKLEKAAKELGVQSMLDKVAVAKATGERLVAARVPLTAAERGVNAAKATVAPLSQTLDTRLARAAKHLRLFPEGQELLERAGSRTPWNRATLMRAELQAGSVELPPSVLGDLESAYQAMSAPQAVLDQRQTVQRDAAAAYMVEATLLREQLAEIWSSMLAARFSRASK